MQYNNQFLSPIITSQLNVFSHYHPKYVHRKLNLTSTIDIIRIYLDISWHLYSQDKISKYYDSNKQIVNTEYHID